MATPYIHLWVSRLLNNKRFSDLKTKMKNKVVDVGIKTSEWLLGDDIMTPSYKTTFTHVVALILGFCQIRHPKRTIRSVFVFIVTLMYIFSFRSFSHMKQQVVIFESKAKYVKYYPNIDDVKGSKVKRILLWTPLYGSYSNWFHFHGENDDFSCEWACEVTIERNSINKDDVVIFSIDDLPKHQNGFPRNRTRNQIWMLHSLNSPMQRNFHYHSFNYMFNWTSFLRTDSDVPTYFRKFVPKQYDDSNGDEITKLKIAKKEKFAVWISHNCPTRNKRERLVQEMKRYMDVDTYGECGEHNCTGDECDEILNEYKFYFAFEEDNCRDYITDHLWRPLELGVIPVVMGGVKDNYRAIAPPSSYIDVTTFDSPQELAVYLRRVAEDKRLYESYFSWKRIYRIGGNYWCDVCQAAHVAPDISPQVYFDLYGWVREDICVPSFDWSHWWNIFQTSPNPSHEVDTV